MVIKVSKAIPLNARVIAVGVLLFLSDFSVASLLIGYFLLCNEEP